MIKLTFNQAKVVIIVNVLAMFMVSLDRTILNMALPAISEEIEIYKVNCSSDTYQFAFCAYLYCLIYFRKIPDMDS